MLLRLLLRDPELPSGVQALAKEFQDSGWKMGDTRLRGVMKRLRKAGHVQRERDGYDTQAGRPRWAFAVYRNPANNPDHAPSPASASSQVSPTRGFSTGRRSAPCSDTLDSNVYAGQPDAWDSNVSESDTLESHALNSNVFAGQTDTLKTNVYVAAPPTPPHREEEDSSSRKSSSITGVSIGAQATDAAVVTAAVEFLAELPGRWACGRKTAASLAPLLAEAVATQGWELDADLVQQLTRRSQARRSAQSVLTERIEDLPRYGAARKALEQERARSARVEGEQLVMPQGEHVRPGEVVLPAGVTPELVERARAFLLTLSGPWTLGPEGASRLAPLLAVKATERGWEFDQALLTQLMSNPDGANNHQLVLERNRIGCLPFRRTTVSGQRRGGRDARQEAIDACSVCDAYGQYEINGRASLCKHDGPSASLAPAPPQPHAGHPGPDVPPQAPLVEAGNGRSRLESLLAVMRQPSA